MEASGTPQAHFPPTEDTGNGQYQSPRGSLNDDSSSHTLHREPSPWIYPTLPALTERYDLGRTMKDEQASASYMVEPLCIDYTRPGLLKGWAVLIHPEGLPYFILPPTKTRPMRVLTEAWLYDNEVMALIQDFLHEIENFVCANGIKIPPDSDLVLQPLYDRDEKRHWCGYYFVYHPRRVLFWLERFDITRSRFFCEVRRENLPQQCHTACYLEFEYWAYWDNFPNAQELTPEIYEYACDVITSSMTDVISSDTTTVAEPYDKLRKMLEIVQASKECRTSNWHIGRFMRHIVYNRFCNYYGQRTARLTRHQSVFVNEPSKPSMLLELLSPLLFCVPDIQVKNMKALSVDGVAVRIHWNKLFEDLTSEWSQTTALATILLTANGAFLAIPLFDNKDQSDAHSSLAQVMSYLSLLTSLSSIIIGLVMYRQHRKNLSCSVEDILAYLKKHKNAANKLEHLALLLSLPYALLMWSMVTFLAAFLVMCFDGTSIITRLCIGCVAVLNFALIVWCIVKFWDTRHGRWESAFNRIWHRFRNLFSRFGGRKQGKEEGTETSQEMEIRGGDAPDERAGQASIESSPV